MAKKIGETAGSTGGYSNSKEKKADAWGNIQVKDATGNFHALSQGFNPLYAEDSGRLHRSLVEKAKASPDGTVEIEAKLVIRLAATDDGTNIEF